jgi:hypothetical protein
VVVRVGETVTDSRSVTSFTRTEEREREREREREPMISTHR